MIGINLSEHPNALREKWGRNDANNGQTMAKPIHENWRNEKGVLCHFDSAYVKGYVDAWKARTGKLLIVTGVIY